MEIFRDPIWQFVGVTVGIGGIIAAVVMYLRQRQRKALSYEILTRTALVRLQEEIDSRLQILFDGQPVQQVHLIVIRIVN